jgi:hypothetical protein
MILIAPAYSDEIPEAPSLAFPLSVYRSGMAVPYQLIGLVSPQG